METNTSVSQACWGFFIFLMRSAASLEVALLWEKLVFVSILGSSLAFYLFTLSLTGQKPKKTLLYPVIAASATFVCLTLVLLDKSYGFGTDELPAPQATLMKLVIEGVLEQKLPWMFVGIGVSIAMMAEALRIPSLPFAVGVYLPVSTMVPVFLGGGLRWLMQRGATSDEQKARRRERGVLFGSGLVGGEGLLGVAIAGVVFYQKITADDPTQDLPLPLEVGQTWATRLAETMNVPALAEVLPSVLAVVVFAALALVFARRCRV